LGLLFLTRTIAALGTALLILSAAAFPQNQQAAALVRQGQEALDAGDFAHAARDFEHARQLAPDSLEANRGLLLSYLQMGRLDDAENIGKESAAKWPKDAELQHWLGLAFFKKAENSEALTALRRSEDIDGSHYDIHFDMALVLLSDSNYAEAAIEFEKAVKFDPKVALSHVLLGRAYQNTNRSMQAVQQFQEALRLRPDIPLGHYHLGFAYASLGRNDEAIAEYKRELQWSANNPEVLCHLGHSEVEAGEWDSAIEHLKKATQIDGTNGDAFYDLGKALLLQGDAENAIPALRRSIALKPSDPTPHYQLSRALDKAGQKEEAKQELETFAALKRNQPVTGGMASGPFQ
jgi:tetratricopeptide (TPR) repeat protein